MFTTDFPSSRSAAKALGAKYYFTGLPCKHGHVALRKTKGACLECLKIESNQAYQKRYEYFVEYNRTKGVENKKKYYEKHKIKVLERSKQRPVELKRQYQARWKQNNPAEVKAYTNDRRRRHKDATPKWLSKEQKAEIRAIYKQALQLCGDRPKAYAVDHIVPLMGKQVCGLHVPWNLQILTAEENFKKNNKLLDTSPKEA